jgi:hypothetical protein
VKALGGGVLCCQGLHHSVSTPRSTRIDQRSRTSRHARQAERTGLPP